MKIQYVIVRHLIRWLTNFYDFRFIWTATEGIGIHPNKAWLSQLVNLKNVCTINKSLETYMHLVYYMVYIYIYIYILHGSVCDLGFHALHICQTQLNVLKKRLINMVNFLFEGGFCSCVCVPLNVCFFVYVMFVEHTYTSIFAFIMACIFTYIHIFLLSVVGKWWGKERECEKRRGRWGGVGGE